MSHNNRIFGPSLVIAFILSAFLMNCTCSTQSDISVEGLSVYLDEALPEELDEILVRKFEDVKSKLVITGQENRSDITLHSGIIEGGVETGDWYYAVCTDFFTTTDTLETAEISNLWNQNVNKTFPKSAFYMDEDTGEFVATVLGKGKPIYIDRDSIIDVICKEKNSFAIVPFHELDPRLKVLRIGDYDLLHKNTSLEAYPLAQKIYAIGDKKKIDYFIRVVGNSLCNRDESKMTVVLMTGTTALTRQTAAQMEKFGVLFPAKDIVSWLLDADYTHISNEVSFYPGCVLDAKKEAMRFCSSEKYLELFDEIGVDIIELSGNHLTDFGTDPLINTLDLFEKRGFRWFAGGRDSTNAEEPLYVTSGPNRIAFIGACAGPSYRFAGISNPGPLKADWAALEKKIRELVGNGWLPIVTIQFFETYEYFPTYSQMEAFRLLAKAGAVIVQGSQAHQPQSFEFYGDSFIHYGLGNLFFDQMWSLGTRQEFLDRHIFYDGRHISTELQTAMLEDYARPRPMNPAERKSLLVSTFSQSYVDGKKNVVK